MFWGHVIFPRDRFHGLQRESRRLVIETSPSHERTSTVDWFFAKFRHGWLPWQLVSVEKSWIQMKNQCHFCLGHKFTMDFRKTEKEEPTSPVEVPMSFHRHVEWNDMSLIWNTWNMLLGIPYIVIQRLKSRSRIGLCPPCPNLPESQSMNLVTSRQWDTKSSKQCVYIKEYMYIFYYILLFSMIDTHIYQQIFRAYR